jgi:hypothetical protein
LLPQVQDLGLRLAQVRGQRFDQIQQQADTFAGTLILDACYIDITKNLINRADSGLATHQFSVKQPGAICSAKSNKNNQKCFSAAPALLHPISVRLPRIIEKIHRNRSPQLKKHAGAGAAHLHHSGDGGEGNRRGDAGL